MRSSMERNPIQTKPTGPAPAQQSRAVPQQLHVTMCCLLQLIRYLLNPSLLVIRYTIKPLFLLDVCSYAI